MDAKMGPIRDKEEKKAKEEEKKKTVMRKADVGGSF